MRCGLSSKHVVSDRIRKRATGKIRTTIHDAIRDHAFLRVVIFKIRRSHDRICIHRNTILFQKEIYIGVKLRFPTFSNHQQYTAPVLHIPVVQNSTLCDVLHMHKANHTILDKMKYQTKSVNNWYTYIRMASNSADVNLLRGPPNTISCADTNFSTVISCQRYMRLRQLLRIHSVHWVKAMRSAPHDGVHTKNINCVGKTSVQLSTNQSSILSNINSA